MPTPPDPLESLARLMAHRNASEILFDGHSLRYTTIDHARVAGFAGGDITLQGKQLTLDAVRAVSLREAFDSAAETLAGI